MTRSPPSTQCAHITRATYLHILHERHLSDLCAYPLCARPPRRPYRAYPLPRSRIVSGANNTRLVVSVTGNDDDGFCSPGCRRRAEWVARVEGAFGDGLWEDGETDEVRVSRWKLLEEVEDASADEQPAPVMTIPGPRSPPTPVIEPRTKPTVKPESSPSSAADVLATLRIVENPTPVTNPAPPQLAPSLSTLPIERTAFQSASPPAAAAFPLEGDRPTTAQIREHERRRRVDASNNSLVPSDVIGFADSLITGAPVDAAPTKNLEVDVVVESEAQDTGNEVRDEDHEAWEMMEAAKREMYGLS